MKIIYLLFDLLRKAVKGFGLLSLRLRWGACGRHVRFWPFDSYFTYKNIFIGNDVYIGQRATFISTESTIHIGNKVLFGPGVTIVTGDHSISKIGVFIKDNRTKEPEDDQPVVIEDDVWVGSNVTILKGVRVGRGSVLASCALILADILPYTIVGGVPCKIIKTRFTLAQAIEHEKILYREGDRFPPNQLRHLTD